MSNQPQPTNQVLTGYTDNPFYSQSILDVFVLQDIIDLEDAERLKAHFKTNREVESFLLKNRLVTRETVNKAYSIILKLPYISLEHVEIPEKVLKIIPEKISQKYGIVPFNIEENIVRIAVSRPSDLLVGYVEGLARFLESKNVGIELFITGETDFREAIKQYNAKSRQKLLLKSGSLPVVYLRNQKIYDRHLKKLPRDFIERYRLVVFGENSAGGYMLAAEATDSSTTRKIVEYLQRENDIKIEMFATSKDDINYALKLYDGKTEGEQRPTDKKKEKAEEQDKYREDDRVTIKGLLDSVFGKGGPELTVDERPDLGKFMEYGSGVKSENKQPEAGKAGREKEPESSEDPDIADKAEPDKKSDNQTNHIEEQLKTHQPIYDAEDNKPDAVSQEKQEKDKLPKAKNFEEKDLSVLLGGEEINDKQALERVVKEGYVPKIVAAVINYAVNSRASDVHIEPGAKQLRIRCRIDGVLEEAVRLPTEFHPPIISRVKILSRSKIDETRIPQDGRFDIMFKKREVDVRVSFLPTVNGEKIVLRVLDKERGVLSLEDLGMVGSAFEMTIKAIGKPWGIILSTGPTGSGKSTTLYAVINRVSVPGNNIITLEDPVEYEIPGINQCQIRPEIGFTFASGLRSVLRQDPNIIMVGEIRDAETASMATHAALTGHLVLSTLHTNDTAGALPRLINMGIEPFLITSSINLIIAQRLVRKICPSCKEEVRVPTGLIEEIRNELGTISSQNTLDRARIPAEPKLYHGKGCSKCSMGFKGRAGIFEVMEITPKIEELATDKRPANEIKQAALINGMITMKQEGILKALAGITTIEEVLQATSNN